MPERLRADRLTPAEVRILTHLATDEGYGDLVWSRPGGWWCGDTRTSGAIGLMLLRKGYISPDHEESESATYYRINEDGERALAAELRGEPLYPPLWAAIDSKESGRHDP